MPLRERYTVPGFRLWLGGREAARVPFEQIVSDLTPYGFLHIFPQDEHERLLIGAIKPGHGKDLDRLTFDDIGDRAAQQLRLKVDKVNWFSVYPVAVADERVVAMPFTSSTFVATRRWGPSGATST